MNTPTPMPLSPETLAWRMAACRSAMSWLAQLNVNNLTNAKTFDTDGGFTLRPQLPLNALFTLRTSL